MKPIPSRILLLALGALVLACNPAERAARELAERNAAARGGLDAWRRVRTMSLAGHLEAGVPRDPVKLADAYLKARHQSRAGARRATLKAAEPPAQAQLPFTLELRRPHATRLEVEFKGERAVQVYDGQRGWKLRPFLGRHEVEPFTDQELKVSAEQGWLDGLLIDAQAKGNTLALEGTDTVEGQEVKRIKVTLAGGQVRRVWVDPKTALEVRIDGTRHLDGKERQIFTYFRDWRAEDGLLVAHTLETVVDGVPGSEKIRVERVALNPELADARFSRPQ